ncbi:MAG: hypothetical protein JXR95_06900 [Deltaproteobacteria bacterium]|nr:hypothetical protein [Deltaproteobacteria bacterium]
MKIRYEKTLVTIQTVEKRCTEEKYLLKSKYENNKKKKIREMKSGVLNSSITKLSNKKATDEFIKKEAAKLAKKELDDFQRKQKEERIEKWNKFMDTFESGFIKAINRFSNIKILNETTTRQLHEIVENSFIAQRDLFKLLNKGELTGQEYHKKSQESRNVSREDIEKLLGKTLSDEFGEYLKEDIKKEFEEMNKDDQNS